MPFDAVGVEDQDRRRPVHVQPLADARIQSLGIAHMHATRKEFRSDEPHDPLVGVHLGFQPSAAGHMGAAVTSTSARFLFPFASSSPFSASRRQGILLSAIVVPSRTQDSGAMRGRSSHHRARCRFQLEGLLKICIHVCPAARCDRAGRSCSQFDFWEELVGPIPGEDQTDIGRNIRMPVLQLARIPSRLSATAQSA
jgi:hypothetical protein